MSAAKRSATFRLEDDLMDGLQKVKERHGIQITEQVTRALEMWLEAMGVQMQTAGDRVSTRLVERLTGKGRILNEERKQVGLCRYDLSVWQEVHSLATFGGRSTVEGLKDFKGTVDQISGDVETDLIGKSLTLQLEDGSELPFFFQDNHGTIAARGQFKRAGEQ